MHGLGNDFIIFDNIKDLIVHDTKFIKKISNRRLGIGCDQVLIIEDTLKPQNFKVTMYNSMALKLEHVEMAPDVLRTI